MTSGSTPTDPAAATVTKTRGGGILQKIQIVFLLFVGVFFGGYFLGTQAQFHLQEDPKTLANIPGMSLLNPPVKRSYWLHTKGTERSGYMTTVVVNGQLVGKCFKPDTNIDITKFMKPGNDIIAFSAKSLPADQHGDAKSFLTIEVRSGERKDGEPNKFEGGLGITEYTRHATDVGDFNDINELQKVE